MHDLIPPKKNVDENKDHRPRKANEYLQMLAGMPPPAMLFDEFWREGELALLFGPSGAGKSMLAVQIAEALARGRSIGSFRMPTKRQRVLYVDLQLSDRQFVLRYKGYHFSGNLYRERPAADKKLCDWLREKIADERYKCVVLDDLSVFRETCDGTRDTLKLMRELAQLRNEFDLSMLVLADCREPRKGTVISEWEMMRSRILCDVADSVFAIAAHPSCPYSRSIVQTRSIERSAWNASNAPMCWIETTEDGLPGLVFDKRFRTPVDDERTRLICEIRRRWNAGETFRKIAAELGISTATAGRLCKKWRPGMEPEPPASAGGSSDVDMQGREEEVEPPASAGGLGLGSTQPEKMEDDIEHEHWPDSYDSAGPPAYAGGSTFTPAHAGGSDPPLDTPRSILLALGFRQSYDKNDREIFIEREDAQAGIAYVWYRFDLKRRGRPEERLSRIQFSGFGTTGMTVDGPICLFNSS